MADERLLAPIRRFWTREQVDTAYEAIFTAYHGRLESVTVIVGKSTEGDSASGQIVVSAKDYLEWMDALEARLQELENADDDVTAELQGTLHTNFGSRYLST